MSKHFIPPRRAVLYWLDPAGNLKPVTVLEDGTLAVGPWILQKVMAGHAFMATHRFENVVSGGAVNVLLTNPSGSLLKIYLASVRVVTPAYAWVDAVLNPTTSGGTSITPINLNLHLNIWPVADVRHTVTASGGTTIYRGVVPGGGVVDVFGGLAGETLVLPPGSGLLVVLTNKGVSPSDVSVKLVWWEGE